MIIAVDVGNSGAKAGAFEGERLLLARRVPAGFSGDLRDLLGVGGAEVEAMVAVSVFEPGLGAFLDGPGRGALVLGRDLPIDVVNRTHRPEEVGADRLVNAAAAHARAGGAAVVADLGSAVTVDAVSAEGDFLGGAIGPGLRALAEGLAATAPLLPPWDGEGPDPGLPRSTRDAIRQGVVGGFAGLAERLVRETEEAMGASPGSLPLVLTGGDAEIVASRLCHSLITVPHLTLIGVRLLYDRAVGGERCG